eukprot:3453616-Rhodomonas_salina.4
MDTHTHEHTHEHTPALACGVDAAAGCCSAVCFGGCTRVAITQEATRHTERSRVACTRVHTCVRVQLPAAIIELPHLHPVLVVVFLLAAPAQDRFALAPTHVMQSARDAVST